MNCIGSLLLLVLFWIDSILWRFTVVLLGGLACLFVCFMFVGCSFWLGFYDLLVCVWIVFDCARGWLGFECFVLVWCDLSVCLLIVLLTSAYLVRFVVLWLGVWFVVVISAWWCVWLRLRYLALCGVDFDILGFGFCDFLGFVVWFSLFLFVCVWFYFGGLWMILVYVFWLLLFWVWRVGRIAGMLVFEISWPGCFLWFDFSVVWVEIVWSGLNLSVVCFGFWIGLCWFCLFWWLTWGLGWSKTEFLGIWCL